MRKLLLTLALLLGATSLHAQCTGSGTVWNCPSGTTIAQVNTMIGSASNNAVATFAVGNYTWTGSHINFSQTKGITLLCATAPNCVVSTTGQTFSLQGCSGTLPNLYRTTGFTFNFTDTGQGIFWFEPNSSGGRCAISQVRIDHNVFNEGDNTVPCGGGHSCTVAFFGDTSSNLDVQGVLDHNTANITGPHPVALAFWIGQYDTSPVVVNAQGTANNIFLEDNTWNTTTNHFVSEPCFTDAWGFARFVIRHNTVQNCLEVVHDLGHAGGPQNVEVYNNKFFHDSGISGQGADTGYRTFHHQGSQVEIFWNNSLSPFNEPLNGDAISTTANYVDTNCGSTYPCTGVPGSGGHGPQPGRDSGGNLVPIYTWGNFDANNNFLVVGGNESNGTIVAANRDLYNSVSASAQTSPTSPFNGTVGVGFGTLANRPSTCTHSNPTHPTLSPRDDGHGGVGYAVETVVGTIGASASAGTASDAVLYTCTATNTWTLAYTPYTYPHPLVGGGTPAVSLSPSPLAFGNQAQNSPVTSSITLTNSGTAALSISSISITTGTYFSISNNPCGSSLGAGNSCLISITFLPTVLGALSDSVVFTTNASSSPDTVSLTGTGVIPTAPAVQMSFLGSAQFIGTENHQ